MPFIIQNNHNENKVLYETKLNMLIKITVQVLWYLQRKNTHKMYNPPSKLANKERISELK